MESTDTCIFFRGSFEFVKLMQTKQNQNNKSDRKKKKKKGGKEEDYREGVDVASGAEGHEDGARSSARPFFHCPPLPLPKPLWLIGGCMNKKNSFFPI